MGMGELSTAKSPATATEPRHVPVDRSAFKTCAQSGFARRHRAFRNHLDSNGRHEFYALIPDTIVIDPTSTATICAQVAPTLDLTPQGETSSNSISQIYLRIAVKCGAVVHVSIYTQESREKCPIYNEKLHLHAAPSSAKPLPFMVDNAESTGNQTRISFSSDNESYSLLLIHSPLQIDLFLDDSAILSFNSRQLMRFERGAVKGAPPPKDLDPSLACIYADGAFDESFNGHVDPKINGPQSVAFDLVFPHTSQAHGLAEHACPFNLPSTFGSNAIYSDPFRLYNLDTGHYEINNPMALYGSIPYLQTISLDGSWSAGAYLLNTSETWVDVARDAESPKLITHWMSEVSPLDIYLTCSKLTERVHARYLALTGVAALPPLWAIGYHQCRWNYNSFEDVIEVSNKLASYDIPCNAIWLDIEHTDGKRYFTWDEKNFAHPSKALAQLKQAGRKLVTINDPHLKADAETYPVYKDAQSQNLLCMTHEGKTFFGSCWPGQSAWLDYLMPKSRSFWAHQYDYNAYVGSNQNTYAWNDMNEPSVFSGPEVTMPKNILHVSGTVEHREIHNVYGMLMQRATFEGQILRNMTSKKLHNEKSLHSKADDALCAFDVTQLQAALPRPFILSRAIFAGSQRYGAIWTGDNLASWEHLRATIPMLLSLSVCGISFAGADVGGFFENPSPELFLRWYQVASTQPFFRSHCVLESPRREPWLFPTIVDNISRAIRARHVLQPTYYTLFAATTYFREMLLRPMCFEFPHDSNVDSERSYMLGSSGILVAPVLDPGVKVHSIYLPSPRARKCNPASWFEWDVLENSFVAEHVSCESTITVPVLNSRTPMFVLGGNVHVLNVGKWNHEAGLHINVVVDNKLEASGRYYFDDGTTLDYALYKTASMWFNYEFGNNEFNAKVQSPSGLNSACQSLSEQNDETLYKLIEIPILTAKIKFPGTYSTHVEAISRIELSASFTRDKVVLEFTANVEKSEIDIKFPPQLTTCVTKWSINFILKSPKK